MAQYKVGILTERMLSGFGADLVIHQVAKGLAKHGYEVEVIASIKDGALDDPDYVTRLAPTPASTYFPAYEKNAKQQLNHILAGRYDAIIVGTFPFFSLIPDLSARGIPCVAIEFGVCPTTGFSLWAKANFAYMQYSQEKIFFARADRIIAISNYLKGRLPQALQAKTDVIYCGVDHYTGGLNLAEVGSTFRQQLGVKPDEVLALYVGRVNPEAQPYKGTKELIEIHDQLKRTTDFRLVMVGRGTPDDAAMLKAHGILAHFNAPTDEMPAIYSACDIFVTGSKWEGFGLPLAEAQYYGKPFVAYGVGAHPEIAISNKAGFLVNTKNEFQQALFRLINDKSLRVSFAQNAPSGVKDFKWAVAAESYANIVSQVIETSRQKSTAAVSKALVSVSIIIVNYESPLGMLTRCLGSLRNQTVKDIEIILVDNGSQSRHSDALYEQYEVQVMALDKNYGFAYAVNRGVERATGEYILVSNFDVEYDPTAIQEMLKVIQTDNKIAGVAPKTLLTGQLSRYIDNMGTLVDPNLQAFNMGIGQLDLGQYDESETVFGTCFAATLLRKAVFQIVGPLDEDYFMYFEDVEWCYRANASGLTFRTAPLAVVHHVHSAATKTLPYSFKYIYIQLNLLKTIVKVYASPKRVLIVLAKMLRSHLVNLLIRRVWVMSTLQILFKFVLSLPKTLSKRRAIQAHRVVSDETMWKYSIGELPYFDPVGYTPIRSITALMTSLKRRALLTRKERERKMVEKLDVVFRWASSSKLQWESNIMKRELYEFANNSEWSEEEKEALRQYIDALVI